MCATLVGHALLFWTEAFWQGKHFFFVFPRSHGFFFFLYCINVTWWTRAFIFDTCWRNLFFACVLWQGEILCHVAHFFFFFFSLFDARWPDWCEAGFYAWNGKEKKKDGKTFVRGVKTTRKFCKGNHWVDHQIPTSSNPARTGMPAAFPTLLLHEACAVGWLAGNTAGRPYARSACSVSKETNYLQSFSNKFTCIPFPKGPLFSCEQLLFIASMTACCVHTGR